MHSLSSEILTLNKSIDIKDLSVCIVTPDILGPIKNGGVGTVFHALAKILAEEGANVTVLFTLGEKSEDEAFSYWVDLYMEDGIELVPLPLPQVGNDNAPKPYYDAYSVYEWLKGKRFGVIHFCDWRGLGFYCVQAKKMNIGFQESLLITNCHGSTMWNWRGNKQIPDSPVAYTYAYIERISVEMSDVVICSSNYMVRWMVESGWILPEKNVFVQPNAYVNNRADIPNTQYAPGKIKEIVFCGRLELRKGLHIFIDSINSLEASKCLDITFIGKPIKRKGFNSLEYIKEKLNKNRENIKVYTDFGIDELIEYMRGRGRLAILPSISDNSPMIITDFLCNRIPFMASEVGGIPEMISDADKKSILFEPNSACLKTKIDVALKSDIYTAKEKIDIDKSNSDWVRWHLVTESYKSDSVEVGVKGDANSDSKITVCLVHHERPLELAAAIKSLEDQSFSEFTVIVVDDGSVSDEALFFLDFIEPRLKNKGWRLIKQSNKYVGAARNLAASCATTKYLVFMDDDNLAKPNELEVMYKAALASNADILTCFADVFDDLAQVKNRTPLRRMLFGGGILASGPWVNLMGDANCIVKKSVFDDLNGFHESYGVGLEDFHFFVKAALKGYQVNVIPESLYWYRVSKKRIQAKHYKTDEARLMIVDEYAGLLPANAKDVFLAALTRSNGGGAAFAVTKVGQSQIVDGRNKPAWAKKIYRWQLRSVSRLLNFQEKILNKCIEYQLKLFFCIWDKFKN